MSQPQTSQPVLNSDMTPSTTSNSTTTDEILYTAFRQKTIDMKHWVPLPDSMPSNRDRLELYALHRQAVSGDAPIIVVTSSNTSSSSSNTATDKAKYNAWKSKSGVSTKLAMQQYIQEADRQIRVYGTTSTSNNNSNTTDTSFSKQGNLNEPSSSSAPLHGNNNNSTNTTGTSSSSTMNNNNHRSSSLPPPTSRGLAAIPLLCAAASEQRISYLRRIQTTSYDSAWWKRQEPLLSAPSTLPAIPEQVLLTMATCIETISLYVTYTPTINEATGSGGGGSSNNNNSTTVTTTTTTTTSNNSDLASTKRTNGAAGKGNAGSMTTTHPPILPHIVGVTIQSYLWPFHNVLLSTWITIILLYMIGTTAIQCLTTIVLGSRRTGTTLLSIYSDQILFIQQSIVTIMESHQPVSVRCIGLLFLPYTFLLRIVRTLNPGLTTANSSTPPLSEQQQQPPTVINSSVLLLACGLYSILIGTTIWYWFWIIPCIVIIGMINIFSIGILGPCFAIIECASQL